MTFKVICRKDVIYKNNTSPLCLFFFHNGRKKSIGLGISVNQKYWDAARQRISTECPNRDEIQFQIVTKVKEYEKKIQRLEAMEIPITFETLFNNDGQRFNITVGDYFEQIIEQLEKVEKIWFGLQTQSYTLADASIPISGYSFQSNRPKLFKRI